MLARHGGMNFCINCTSLALLHQVSCSSETVQKAPERKETHQNMRLGSNSVDRERSLQKILTRQCGLNFCINCSGMSCCAATSVQQPNGPKCTQRQRNDPTPEF